MFPCDKCGACCRSLKLSPLYAQLDRGDGVCRFLTGNLCGIYDTRPLLCRVDECYEEFFKEEMSVEEYYRLNRESCQKLREQDKNRQGEL